MQAQEETTGQEPEEEYAGEEYYSVNPGHIHGKSFWYIVSYMVLLAILVVPANALHMGFIGVVTAMAVAALVLVLFFLIGRAIKRKIGTMRMSARDWLAMLIGYRETHIVEADGYQVDGQAATTGKEIVSYEDPDALPDSIIEDDGACISERFIPNIDRLIGAMVLIVGMRRAGKSNLLAVLFEELARYGLPFVLFDTMDEYSGLMQAEYLRNGVLVGSGNIRRDYPHAQRCKTITLDNAYQFGRAIMDGLLQVVVNLRSYDDETAALVMCEIIEGINDWQEERVNDKRVPVIAGIDEAQKWLPQDLSDSCVSKATQQALHRAWFDKVVARGGKNGWTPIAATQRYSQINKKFLQSLFKFLMFQSEETDLARYEKYNIPREATLALRQGECFIFSPLCLGFQTVVRKRYSPHYGNTPGRKQLQQHRHQAQPVDVLLSRSFLTGSLRGKGPQFDTAISSAVGDGQQDNAQVAERSHISPRLHTTRANLEARAIEEWNKGHKSGRKLAAALDISDNAGNALMNRLLARHLIER